MKVVLTEKPACFVAISEQFNQMFPIQIIIIIVITNMKLFITLWNRCIKRILKYKIKFKNLLKKCSDVRCFTLKMSPIHTYS